MMKKHGLLVISFLVILILTAAAHAQTSGFTYQGRFTDASQPQPTNGTYAMQFALFDAATNGTQIGTTVTNPTVRVVNGVFTVNLDFGASSFNGSARFLQVTVSSTVLTPRQAISSAPYSVRSGTATTADNALNLGGVAANQYTQTNDPRLTDDRTPTAGSANYIQNTTTPQAASNFNISGNGTAGGTLSGNVVNAATQFNLNGARFLSNAGTANFFAGELAGTGNTTGRQNAFVGHQAGAANTTGNFNAFSGQASGRDNTTGSGNSFFGALAGLRNTTGDNNAFVGAAAGQFNTTGFNNAFVGAHAGENNTTGDLNAFVGAMAGQTNTTGRGNAFVGANAGFSNTTGTRNAFFGNQAGQVNTTGDNNAFVGAFAGASNSTGGFNTFIGRQAGPNVTTGSGNVFIGNDTGVSNVTGNSNTAIGSGVNVADNLSFATAIGSLATVSTNNTIVLGRSDGSDRVRVPGGMGGLLALNDNGLRLRGGNDSNHVIAFNSQIDGIEFRANDQFLWTRANGNTTQMRLFGNGVLATRGGFNGRCTGTFFGDGVCNQDLAETFRTKEQTEAGDVVTLIPEDNERPTVRRSLRAYDEHLVGVVSTNPGLVFDEGETKLAGENDHYITKDKTVVAAVGRVPVKFTLENGAINVGDALTSSATEPGKAMKATGAGKIIGLALESSDKAQLGATPDRLLMWLQVGQNSTHPAGASSNTDKTENAELKAQLGQLRTETAAMKQFICSQTPNASFCKQEEK